MCFILKSSQGQVHRTDVVREIKLSLRKPVGICRNTSMACVDEQESPGQTQTHKGSLQRVEARTGSQGETEKLSEPPGVRLGKRKP